MSRLEDLYHKKILPELLKELNYTNPWQAPRLTKVVLNMGVGKAVKEKKELEDAVNEMTLIAGQKAVPTKAKKSISSFNLRAGVPIGCRVTLRRRRMYEFTDKLFNVVLPRTRDFQGLSRKGFDGQGNYTLGIAEQVIFPEIDPTKAAQIRGLQVTFVTTAHNNEEAELLLRKLGCPLQKE